MSHFRLTHCSYGMGYKRGLRAPSMRLLLFILLGQLCLTPVEPIPYRTRQPRRPHTRQPRRPHTRQQRRRTPEAAKVQDYFDPYKVLGVDDEATDRQVKRAFRQLSIKWHPDKNQGNTEATRQFQEIYKAYEILSNGDKKMLFDMGGMDLVNKPIKKGKDFHLQIKVELEDMYNGGEYSAKMTRRVICRHCGKYGKNRHMNKCKRCTVRCPNTVKMVPRRVARDVVIQQQREVPSTEKCKHEPKTLTAVIEKGMPHNEKITFARAAEQKLGFIPGDVVMVIKQKKHRRFERRGNDLYHQMTISLKQALTGYQTTLPHLDEHVVEIDTAGSIVRDGEVRTFTGEGMPVHGTPSEAGNLHVTFVVEFPKRLDNNQLVQLKKLLP